MNNPFSFLAAQVRKGREQAADKLHEELCPELEWLVRRILYGGDDGTPFGKRVQREAWQLHEGEAIPFDSEPMVHRVVDRLWQGILGQLQGGRPAQHHDTWRRPGQTMVAC